MNIASKGWSVLVSMFLVALSISLIVTPANAQSFSNPTEPTFTVQYIKEVSQIPPVTIIDPYTGNEITANLERVVYNETILFTINNQAFKQCSVSSDVDFFFNFRFKGHYEEDWQYDPFQPDGTSVYAAGGWFTGSFPHFTASNSDYTLISFNMHNFVGYQGSNDGPAKPNGGELDFQVQAQIGKITPIDGSGTNALGSYYKFTGESSSWSETQTLVIIADEEPSPTPTVPEFSAATLLLLLSNITIVTVFLKRKQQRKP